MNKNINKKTTTELVFILDRSGSMFNLTADTIGGFNYMIQKQKNKHTDTYVSTVLFNDEITILHNRVKLSDVSKMTNRDYHASGTTALLDAIGSTIKHISNIHKHMKKENIPTKTMVVITTDGMENASKNYNFSQIKEMIETQKQRYDWEFIFLAANIDAIETGIIIGIDEDHSVKYKADKKGTEVLYQTLYDAVDLCCEAKSLPKNWKEDIERDYISRKNK